MINVRSVKRIRILKMSEEAEEEEKIGSLYNLLELKLKKKDEYITVRKTLSGANFKTEERRKKL